MALEHLQPNDRVYAETRFGKKILKIDRVTKTQIITEDDARWNRKHGSLVGASIWDSAHIYELTSELEVRAKEYQLAKQKHDVWYSLVKLPFPPHISLDRLHEIHKELKG